jgi:hypothetical protein
VDADLLDLVADEGDQYLAQQLCVHRKLHRYLFLFLPFSARG